MNGLEIKPSKIIFIIVELAVQYLLHVDLPGFGGERLDLFQSLAPNGGPAPIASDALERIGAVYAVESEIRGLAPDERRAVR